MSQGAGIRENLGKVQDQIQSAAAQAGRSPEEIQLLVVTKKHPVETLQALIDLGVRDLGESYAQEGLAKKEALRANGIDLQNLKWHMVGHVQSRKANIVVQHFDWLHSLDSLKLAQRLNRSAQEQGSLLPVLLQVNIAGESTKFGFPAQEGNAWPQLFSTVEDLAQFKHLKIQGLMNMAPIVATANEARPHFARTRKLRDLLAANFADLEWNHLSMGMSADFEAAILEGATIIRVGSKILGPRPN